MINLTKMFSQNRYILTFLLILNINFCVLKACEVLNPNNYGNCGNILGYVWSGQACSLVYGCDSNNVGDSFFNTFEECSLTCQPTYSLGDLNEDNIINVIDIIALISMILDDTPYIHQADINFDSYIDLLDIIVSINVIFE